MRVLIVEPHATGHHASYLRWLVEAAVQGRWRVAIATTPEALLHPLLSTILAEFRDTEIYLMKDLPRTDSSANRFRLLLREFAYWEAIRKITTTVKEKTRVDAAILPYIEYCFHAAAIRGSPFQDLPWCGISMRMRVDIKNTSSRIPLPLKWRLAERILGNSALSALFVINPSVRDLPPDWCSEVLQSKLRYLPDPAEHAGSSDRCTARASLGIFDDQVLVLVYGSIDERKGIEALLDAVSDHSGLENYVVIIAGKQSATYNDYLRGLGHYETLRSKGRLIIFDHFVTGADQELLFGAADVVWVGYRNHIYMSGVLVLAGMAALPVIGTTGGEIGRLISRHNLGAAINIESRMDVARALSVMLDADLRRQMGRRAQATFESHTVENFKGKILAALPAAVA